MRKLALLLTGLAIVATTTYGGEGNVRRSARRIPGRYVVALQPGADVTALANKVRGIKGARIRHTYKHGLRGMSLELSDVDAQALARDPLVRFVEEDSTMSATAISWALDRIDQRALPLDDAFAGAETGAGVTIYVVDTGIAAGHDDFGGRVTAGFNAIADGASAEDCNGHGTHVAGLAGGAEYGVAKSATLVPVRVLDCSGAGSVSTVLAGLDWILADHQANPRPAVVNLSLSGDVSSAVDIQVDDLASAGLVTVVAAGNGNTDACWASPARVPSAITVGATTDADQRADFSNYGLCVDLFAPGVNISSDYYAGQAATAVSSGTSAASPLVAGVAALWLERYPDTTPGVIAQSIGSNATPGVVGGITEDSPNRLLYAPTGALDESPLANTQLLADPGFEDGTIFWTSEICTVVRPTGCGGFVNDTSGIVGTASFPSRSGSNHASIGGSAKNFQIVSETVSIPASVKRAELSLHLWVVTKNRKALPADVFTVEIRDPSGALIETLGTFSNLDETPTYSPRKFDVSRYRGTSVRIAFTGIQSQGPPTWFLLDDVALNVWR